MDSDTQKSSAGAGGLLDCHSQGRPILLRRISSAWASRAAASLCMSPEVGMVKDFGGVKSSCCISGRKTPLGEMSRPGGVGLEGGWADGGGEVASEMDCLGGARLPGRLVWELDEVLLRLGRGLGRRTSTSGLQWAVGWKSSGEVTTRDPPTSIPASHLGSSISTVPHAAWPIILSERGMEWTDAVRTAEDIETYLVANLRPLTEAETLASGVMDMPGCRLLLCYAGAEKMHYVVRQERPVMHDEYWFYIGAVQPSRGYASASAPTI